MTTTKALYASPDSGFNQMLEYPYDGDPMPLDGASSFMVLLPPGIDDKDDDEKHILAKDASVTIENQPHDTKPDRWLMKLTPYFSPSDIADLPEGATYRLFVKYKHGAPIRFFDGDFNKAATEEQTPAPTPGMDEYQQRLAERGL